MFLYDFLNGRTVYLMVGVLCVGTRSALYLIFATCPELLCCSDTSFLQDKNVISYLLQAGITQLTSEGSLGWLGCVRLQDILILYGSDLLCLCCQTLCEFPGLQGKMMQKKEQKTGQRSCSVRQGDRTINLEIYRWDNVTFTEVSGLSTVPSSSSSSSVQ